MGRSPWLRVYARVLDALVSGLAFAPAPLDTSLASHPSSNSPDHNAKGTQSGPTRVAPDAPSYRLWACGFRLSFTPRPGVLFTCPSRYSSAIGHTGVFSLGGWSPRLHARLLVPGVTQELHYEPSLAFAYGALTRSGAPSQGTSAGFSASRPWVLQPRGARAPRFRLVPFRSPLLRESRLISLPPGTEMFQFPGFASPRRVMTGLAPRRVAPFGHLGLIACVRLPRAFRSLPRPSSPPCAQASPTCPRSLDYTYPSSRARAWSRLNADSHYE
jgi:hypothetical protein